MNARPTILVFDSGLGGLTVFRELAAARPDASYVYVADDAFFPYGRHSEEQLVGRIVPLMGELIATHAPDLAVIACNTASTLVLPHLRARFSLPFVGTVPAIKPACGGSRSKLVSVLGTKATVEREYTRALIREFAGDVKHALLKPLLQFGIDRAAQEFLEVLPQLGAKFIRRHGIPRNADDREVTRQQVIFRQVVKGGNQLALRKIAGSAENDHRAGIARSPDLLCLNLCCALRHALHSLFVRV